MKLISFKTFLVIIAFINLLLLLWSLGYIKIFQNNLSNNTKVSTIYPKHEFKKTLPPQDDNFPNENSNVWKAFENNIELPKKLETESNTDKNNKEKIKTSEAIPLEKNNNLKAKKLQKGIDVDQEILNKENIPKEEILENVSKTEKNIKSKLNTSDKEKKIESKEVNKGNTRFTLYVQVASLSKKKLVNEEWVRLKRKHSESLINLNYIIEEINLKNNKTFFRLLVGEFNNNSSAERLCTSLKITSSCIIKKISK